MRYFKAKEYNWSGLSEQQGVGGKLKRAALQFTPYTFDDFDWRAFSTPVRCLESLGLVAIFLLLEVNGSRPRSFVVLGDLLISCDITANLGVPQPSACMLDGMGLSSLVLLLARCALLRHVEQQSAVCLEFLAQLLSSAPAGACVLSEVCAVDTADEPAQHAPAADPVFVGPARHQRVRTASKCDSLLQPKAARILVTAYIQAGVLL